MNNPPLLSLLTFPAPREEIVVEPETVRRVTVVDAKVEVAVTNNGPETVRPVVEAVPNVVWPVTLRVPPTVSKLLMVVEPVTARVLETLLKVKLVEVPIIFVP